MVLSFDTYTIVLFLMLGWNDGHKSIQVLNVNEYVYTDEIILTGIDYIKYKVVIFILSFRFKVILMS